MATQVDGSKPAETVLSGTHTLGESVPETVATGLPVDPTRTAGTVDSTEAESDPAMSGRDSLRQLPESQHAEETFGGGGSDRASRSGGAEGDLELQTLPEETLEMDRSENTSQQGEEQLQACQTDDCGSRTKATVGDEKVYHESLPQAGQDLVDTSTYSRSEQPSRTDEDVSDALANVHLDNPSQEVVDEAEHQLSTSPPAQEEPRDSGYREDLPLSTQSEASSSHTPSQQLQVTGELGDSSNRRLLDLGRPTNLSPMASLTSSEREARDSHTPGSLSGSGEDSEPESGRLSPFLLVSKDNITNVSELESPGLLYASGIKEKHNRDLYAPPDEVAQDVLEFSSEVQLDSGARVRVKVSPGEGASDRGTTETNSVEQSIQSATERRRLRKSVPIDPGALLQLEIHAKQVAGELNYMMDNLRNSLHAMTACTVQSVELHRESVDNLHQVVDVNVKAMYSFMAKFEELQKNLAPLQEIAAQIKEISEALKILERSVRLS